MKNLFTDIKRDLPASVVVFLVAVPLCLGIALASGAPLLAGLIAGPVSWLISLAYKPVYTGGLISELTTFAAFTALLVFLPAVLGVAIGRWLTDRNAPAAVRHGHAHDNGDFDRADTDVFAAVRDETADDTADVAAPQRAE